MTRQPICTRPWTGFELVDHLGDVRPCCWGKISCGNINDSSPDQIWTGSGFQLYRDKMIANDLESICNPSCPILQGQYKEVTPALDQDLISVGGHILHERTPIYLRVVPTTKCNLHCPMCYQADAPVTRLPKSLFESLKPWIRQANELLVLGGETFIARECLAWIERVTPSEYPTCRLAAITNGLGFSSEICDLIVKRHWSWILISIDAASAPVYDLVRGGNFDDVLLGLQTISDVRAIQPFELRLGFTLQRSNLNDAVAFVDLCADYDATPQFTVVAGDWHGESPTDHATLAEFYAALELVDKRLAERGFSERLISSALASLRARSHVWSSCYKVEASKYISAKEDRIDILVQEWPACRVWRKGAQVRVDLYAELEPDYREDFASQIEAEQVDYLGVNIPFFKGRAAISALDVRNTIDWLIRTAGLNSWVRPTGHVDLTALGLNPRDCTPSHETVAQFGMGRNADLAVISPVFNRETILPWFLASVLPQLTSNCELILVDDGSTDNSLRVAREYIRGFHMERNVKILKINRQETYERGTFTFGAGVARQIAVTSSNATKLAFIDPDQLVAKDCLKAHRFFLEQGFQVVMGDRRDFDLDIDTTWRSLRNQPLCSRKNWWTSFCTANASVERRLFDAVGGFDPAMQYWGLDDTDLGYRLFVAEAKVWHTLRSSVVHLDPEGSGAGESTEERMRSYRLHMEVLYRKYLCSSILDCFAFL